MDLYHCFILCRTTYQIDRTIVGQIEFVQMRNIRILKQQMLQVMILVTIP